MVTGKRDGSGDAKWPTSTWKMATAKGKTDSADCARRTVLTGQTVLWIKDEQCCVDNMSDGQRQCNKQRQGRQMAPQPQP